MHEIGVSVMEASIDKKPEEKDSKNSIKIFGVVIIVSLLVISIVFAVLHNFSQPSPSAPEILSYEGHRTGDDYVVYVNVINNGAEGWVKVKVSALYIGPEEIGETDYSQRTYLKNGESDTLQFIFSSVPDNFDVYTESVNEGGSPEISTHSEKIGEESTYHFGFCPFNWPIEIMNQENITFRINFINFTYEGTLWNGSKIYFLYINLTNLEDVEASDSPILEISLKTSNGETSPGGEITVKDFKPLESKITITMFIVPEGSMPKDLWLSRGEKHTWIFSMEG